MTIVTLCTAYGSAGSSGFVVMSAEKLKDLKVHDVSMYAFILILYCTC